MNNQGRILESNSFASEVKKMSDRATSLEVVRTVRDGWFLYTCDKLPGLLISSKDDRKAYNDLPNAIKVIFKLDFDVDVMVAHVVDYENFLQPFSDSVDCRPHESDFPGVSSEEQHSILPFMIGRTKENLSRYEQWSNC